MREQLLGAECACGHSHTTSANGCGAGDVFGRIADDDDIAASKGTAFSTRHALDGDGAKVIAVFGIIAKGSIGEEMVNTEAGKFQLGTSAEISREKAKMQMLASG